MLPERPSLDNLESKWGARWEEAGTYHFDRASNRESVYALDTPPPTVSGSLHLGTVFGYIQADSIARFRRMQGYSVFYPVGWDDNGLPTERRVQNHYGVRCEPAMPYDPAGIGAPAPAKSGEAKSRDGKSAGSRKEMRPISRRNFVELCHELTAEDERGFEDTLRNVGLSVDWRLTYATIDDHCRRVAQRAFLRNVRRGEAYASEAPTLWDIDFRTAVAQAELEEREQPAAYHRLAFTRPDGGRVEVDTTRPELLPACVALVAHPDDARYRPLFGTTVATPLFGAGVPVLAHPLAEPGKGTGIAMICTFGDTTDIIWWRELNLPVRSVLRRDGRLQEETPDWLTGPGAELWPELGGRTVRQARARIVDLLRDSGVLLGEPRPTEHMVKFYEKGDRPLEIVTSRQWYIRNGAHDPELRQAMLARGRELQWHPAYMRVRYEHWVEGLSSDWLISRQRYFGVPFPVWYPTDGGGEPVWDKPIYCAEDALPTDPQSDAPPGYGEGQRGQPNGFVADPDVMDTWATSSLTPQIACGWEEGQREDRGLFARTFPMDLRPQGPEIIRTWLFSTVLRSHLELGQLPWAHASINGWILDPDRKKMSKSKGNVITPEGLVAEFGADGLRYWSCSSAPGTDTAVDKAQMKVGRRLANKVLNASRFVLGLSAEESPSDPVRSRPDVTEALDRAMLAQLATVTEQATAALDRYEYHLALEQTEKFFWDFCDDYLELVKSRAYGQGQPARSAQAALRIALDTLLRLFAPFLPFVAEEAWSWWRTGSVHRAPWPEAGPLRHGPAAEPEMLPVAASVLAEVRKAKSEQRRSLRTEVARLSVTDTPRRIALLRGAEADLRAAGVLSELSLAEAAEPSVTVELAPDGR
ncbi:MAG: valine--tRNA ligase [Streptosporangiaceae bacterium]